MALALERIEAEAWADHHVAAPPDAVRELGISVHRLDGGVALLASRGNLLFLNRVLALGCTSTFSAGRLPELLVLYDRAGVLRFVVQWSPCAQSVVDSDFRAAGFRDVSRQAKLWRRPDPAARADTTLEIREVGPNEATLFGETVRLVYDGPRVLASMQSAIVGRPGWRHYLAFDGPRPVAGGALFVHERIAWCGFGATIPEARGRGAHSALLAVRVRDAAAMRCELVVCETAEETTDRPNPSYRNMRRAGFNLAYLRTNWLRDGSARSVEGGEEKGA